jgi:nucleotide-binding universal stress UspA family protein
MGTHGHTALANLVVRPVATKVLASGEVPVLFLK